MLQVTELKRSFKMTKGGETITLEDPNPALSADEVLSFYSNSYPELTTATVARPVTNGEMLEFEFKTTVGTKG